MDRIPAPALFMAAGFSQFFGAAIAVGLFAFAPPHTVAWMRSVVAGVIIVALIRPWRTTWTKKTLTESGLFGLLLLGMNMFVYIAINYLPLGAAITLEFVGPILVAVWRGQGVSSRIAAILAMVGVFLISLFGLDWGGSGGLDLVIGLVAISIASAAWAGYIVLGSRIARERSGHASLAVGMVIATLVYAPIAAPWAGGLFAWHTLLPVVAVGILTSVIPYMLDQVTIRRLPAAAFALLNSLLPATATLVGFLVLRQIPTLGELTGLAAITVAVMLANRPTTPHVKDGDAKTVGSPQTD